MKLEQLTLPIPSNSTSAAMKAPTKQRSMKATKSADRRVDPSRRRVAMAQAQARMETMKRTRMKEGVNSLLEL